MRIINLNLTLTQKRLSGREQLTLRLSLPALMVRIAGRLSGRKTCGMLWRS